MILFEIEVFLFYAKCGHLEDIFLSFFLLYIFGRSTYLPVFYHHLGRVSLGCWCACR